MSAFAQAADAEDGDMIDGLRAQRDELLDALQEIVAAADGEGWDQIDADFIKARAAIAKATGETK